MTKEITGEDLLNEYTGQKRTCKYGKWKVNINGDMEYNSYYFIDNHRLKNEDWIIHMNGKRWINWNEFMPAYLQACGNAGIQRVAIKTYY